MKKCPKCEIDIPDDSIICPNCGNIVKNSKPILLEKLGLIFSIVGFVISAVATVLTFAIGAGFAVYLSIPSFAFGIAGCVLSAISIKKKKTAKAIAGLIFSSLSLALSLISAGFYVIIYIILKGISGGATA